MRQTSFIGLCDARVEDEEVQRQISPFSQIVRRSSVGLMGSVEPSGVAPIHRAVERGEGDPLVVGEGPLSAQVQLQSAEKSKRRSSELEIEARVEFRVDATSEWDGVR